MLEQSEMIVASKEAEASKSANTKPQASYSELLTFHFSPFTFIYQCLHKAPLFLRFLTEGKELKTIVYNFFKGEKAALLQARSPPAAEAKRFEIRALSAEGGFWF